MNILTTNIKWLMLVSGALTFTMVYAAIAPEAALASTFGATLDGPVAEVVVRNWGALIALVGGMLIYAAFDPPSRPMVLVVASLSKAVFIALVLAQGRRFIGYQAGPAIIIDSVMVALFVAYLIARRNAIPQAQPDHLAT